MICIPLPMHVITTVVVFIYLCLIQSIHSSNKNKNIICQWRNDVESETSSIKTQWNLIWQEEFVSKEIFEKNWNIENEIFTCHGNYVEQLNCNTNRTENIQIIDDLGGHLILTARKEKYNEKEFTAASITTKEYFTYGRYEIRASNPLGNYLRTSIFTRNENEQYWHENGQIDLYSYTQSFILHRGVHYANSVNFYENADLLMTTISNNKPSEYLHDFHIFGVEWNEQGIRFFMDNKYSQIINFINGTKYLKPFHQIRLQIGVGGIFFAEKNFSDKIQWKCPAMIVDYIRIYEQVQDDPIDSEKNLTTSNFIPKCVFHPIDHVKDQQILEQVCSTTQQITNLQSSSSDSDDGTLHLSSYQFVILLISILIVLFVIVSTYLIIQIKQFGSKVAKVDQLYGVPAINLSQSQSGMESDYETFMHYELPIYHYAEFENKYNNQLDNNNLIQSSKSLQNEYLEIKSDNQVQPQNFPEESSDYIILSHL